MKKAFLMCAVALLSLSVSATAMAEQGKRSYALIVANNSSVDADVEPLRFADDDGARFFELFESTTQDATVLTTLDTESQGIFPQVAAKSQAPTRENLRAQVKRIQAKIAADRKAGVESEMFLVFTGHGNVDASGEGYLSLADGKLKRSDLYRDVIRPLNADFTHVIIDACHAYFMVRARGGEWKDDRSGESLDMELESYLKGQASNDGRMNNIGVILSTAGAAEVHEWSRYRAGVFSHQLRSGLLGAADANADGNITYQEIEAYLAAANAAVQNPKAKILVHAAAPKQDLQRPLTRLADFKSVTQLTIDGGDRLYVEDSRGLRYADMHLGTGTQAKIALLRNPASGYYLRTDKEQASVPLDQGAIAMADLTFAQQSDQSRGAVEEAFRADLFATPFGPSFMAGYSAGRELADQRISNSLAPQQQSAWDGELSLDYTIGAPALDADGFQHQVGTAYVFRHESGFGVGPFAEYGITPGDALTVHRISVGVDGSFMKPVGNDWALGARLRLGNQTVLQSADVLAADPIGLRTEGALVGGWNVNEAMRLEVVGGLGVDVVTQSNLEENVENVFLSPFAGAGLRF